MIVVHVKEKSRSKLAHAVADTLQCPVIAVSADHFADGETHLPHFNTRTIADQEILLVHQFFNTGSLINAQIFDLLMFINFLKASGVKKIVTLLPYLPYARQDQPIEHSTRSVLSFLSLFLEQSGVSMVLCSDIHSPRAHNSFDIPFCSIGLEVFWAGYIKKNILKETLNTCIATPDLGGKERAQKVAQALGLPLIIAEKKRIIKNQAIVLNITGRVQDQTVILIDDILATGSTAINTCNLLKEKGAKEVIGCFSHAVLAPGAGARLAQSNFDKIYMGNTLLGDLTPEMAKKIQAVCVYEFLGAQALNFLNNPSKK